MSDEPALTLAEVERRVINYLKGKPVATRDQWRALGSQGMRLLYTIAVSAGGDDARQRLRAAALATLGQLGGVAGMKPLVDALTEPEVSTMVRCGAIEGLGHVGHSRAIPVLQSQAYHAEFKVRLYALSALARIGTAGGRRIIEDMRLKDPHSQVRRAASVELKKLDAAKAAKPAKGSAQGSAGAAKSKKE
jgi:HEAT repeat protein